MSILLACFGAVVLLVAVFGIPLGMTPREPTLGEYLVLLLVAGVSAAIGGRLAARRADPQHGREVVLVLAAAVAVLMLWGFSGPASHWPRWCPPTLALFFAAGICGGGLLMPNVRR